MALNQAQILSDAKDTLLEDLAKLADSELFGLDPCKRNWPNILRRYNLIDLLDCAQNQFTQAEKDCLLPKLVENVCT